jgi:hypothetical protein
VCFSQESEWWSGVRGWWFESHRSFARGNAFSFSFSPSAQRPESAVVVVGMSSPPVCIPALLRSGILCTVDFSFCF